VGVAEKPGAGAERPCEDFGARGSRVNSGGGLRRKTYAVAEESLRGMRKRG